MKQWNKWFWVPLALTTLIGAGLSVVMGRETLVNIDALITTLGVVLIWITFYHYGFEQRVIERVKLKRAYPTIFGVIEAVSGFTTLFIGLGLVIFTQKDSSTTWMSNHSWKTKMGIIIIAYYLYWFLVKSGRCHVDKYVLINGEVIIPNQVLRLEPWKRYKETSALRLSEHIPIEIRNVQCKDCVIPIVQADIEFRPGYEEVGNGYPFSLKNLMIFERSRLIT